MQPSVLLTNRFRICLLAALFPLLMIPAAYAAEAFGNGTVQLPTTASGGTGSVADLQADDDTRYTIAKSGTLTVGGFEGYAGAINSVYLFVQYAVEDGYGGSNEILVNGVSTGIVPADRDYGRIGFVEITGGSFGIDTTAEIESMTVTFTNNDGGGGDDVLFDYVLVVVNPVDPIPQPPTWSEDFNGTGQANPMVWRYEDGYQRNNELQYYVVGDSNGWMENGNFVIEGREESMGGYNYTSASIQTETKYYWHYGRAQIRAKIPAIYGMWPAIWGVGEDGSWPHNGEVDIMEYYKEKILANCAVGKDTQWSSKWDTATRSMASLESVDANWRDEYHIWTMQWDEDNVRLYVDNILMNVIPQSWLVNPDGTLNYGPKEPFKQPFTCWLNLAIGGNGGGSVAGVTFPQRYYIDYWKIWEGATGNVAPTDITLDTTTVPDLAPAGTVVGYLSATDADPAEVHRYALVSGTGDTHNSQFTIPEFLSDNTLQGVLKTAQTIDYANGATRSIRVRVTDIEGATYDKVFTLNVAPDDSIEVSTDSVTVSEGGTQSFNVKLRTLPVSNVTVNVARSTGDSDISVSSGATLTFTPANGTDWQTVTLAAAEDVDVTNGTATIVCSDAGSTYSSASVTASEIDNDNLPPVVDAGENQTVAIAEGETEVTASLDGTVTDADGPASGSVTTAWSTFSGPGMVTFGDASAVDTTATFTQTGTYVLRLTATDISDTTDDVTITVNDGADTDSDGMDDTWEQIHFGDLDEIGSGDFDSDGYTNLEEFLNGTDPTVDQAPDAPANLVASFGDGQVSLDWDDNTDPDLASYTVKRSLTSGSGFAVIQAGLTTSSYVDSSVTNGTEYFYMVTAFDNNGSESAPSNEDSATPITGTIFQGNGVSGELDNYISNANNWTLGLPVGNQGTLLVNAGFNTDVSHSGYNIQHLSGTVSRESGFSGFNLSGGSNYVMNGSAAAFSGTRGLKLTDSTFTLHQGNADMTANGSDSVITGSSALLTINGGTFSVGRDLFFKGGNMIVNGGILMVADEIKTSNLSSGTNSLTFNGGTTTVATNLTSDPTRFMQFTFGGSTTGSLTASGVLSGPSTFDWLPGTKMAVTISGSDEWAAAEWAADRLMYNGQNATALGKSWAQVTAADGLAPGVRFEYDSGTETLSLTAPAAPTPPLAASALSATGGNTSVSLSWTDNSDNETGFKVQRSTTGGSGFSTVHTTAADATSYDDTGLSAGTAYYYQVIATNAGGDSDPTPEANATTWTDEQAYFDSKNLSHDVDPNHDSDLDGISNHNEYLAGTDPNNDSSVFEVTGAAESGGILLQVPRADGRFYRVCWRASLVSGDWTAVSGHEGTNAQVGNDTLDLSVSTDGFYRVEASNTPWP